MAAPFLLVVRVNTVEGACVSVKVTFTPGTGFPFESTTVTLSFPRTAPVRYEFQVMKTAIIAHIMIIFVIFLVMVVKPPLPILSYVPQ
jgi:hypothetical protein